MSQSKTSYGVKSPKGTARSRHAQHINQSETTSSETIEPACRSRSVGRAVERREWREMPYDGRARAFFEPCGWPECFPDGKPSEDEVETVVRSCGKPTTYHRPRNNKAGCEARTHDEPPETSANSTRISQESIEPVGTIDTLTELREGQQVIWKTRPTPLRVTEATTEADGTIHLLGPDGGEYTIEGRPDCPHPYYATGYGYQSEIIRVRLRDRAEAV
jgi:hypothetical protein